MLSSYYNNVVLWKSQGGDYPTDYVRYWNFADQNNRLVDVVNGATLTAPDSISYVAGANGGTAAYNNDRSFFLTIDNPIQLAGKTFAFHFKPTNLGGYTVLMGTNYIAYDPLAIITDQFAMQRESWIGFGDTLVDNTYYTAVAKFGTTTIDIYLNGINTYSATGVPAVYNQFYANSFGHYPQASGLALIGNIQDIMVYDRLLTDEEILTLNL